MKKEHIIEKINELVSDDLINRYLSNRTLNGSESCYDKVFSSMIWVRETIIRDLDIIDDPEDISAIEVCPNCGCECWSFPNGTQPPFQKQCLNQKCNHLWL